jgi:hypothetical protein
MTRTFPLFLLAIVIPLNAQAFEVERVTIRWDKYHTSARHPMYRFGERQRERVSLQVDTRVFWRVYWFNDVHGESSDRQFRSVGLRSNLRVRIWPWLTIGLEHHSRHWLDMGALQDGFPVQDSVFIQLNLFGTPRHKYIIP